MLSMIPSVARGITTRDLARIKRIVRNAFPSVQQISPQTLSKWLGAGNQSVLLIDVRSPREFGVSHIHSAVNARTPTEILKAIIKNKPARTVLYCSVGFRSSMLVTKLPDSTADETFNLEGSIFEWANEGRPVFHGDRQVSCVHPYGKRWAGLLLPGLASDLGDEEVVGN